LFFPPLLLSFYPSILAPHSKSRHVFQTQF
jgi:hypothetical protein